MWKPVIYTKKQSSEEKNQYPFLKDKSIDFILCVRVFPREPESAAAAATMYIITWCELE